MRVAFVFDLEIGGYGLFNVTVGCERTLILRPDVEQWCRESLSTLPVLYEEFTYERPWVSELVFATDADAVAFQLRWSDEINP